MWIVIDTNIIISAFLTKNGRCRIFMDDVFAEKYEVIVSKTIVKEYERKLKNPKFSFEESTINMILDWFENHAIEIEIDETQSIPEMDNRDATDKPFYLLAKCTHALLVTGNIKHYPVEEWRTMIWELT